MEEWAMDDLIEQVREGSPPQEIIERILVLDGHGQEALLAGITKLKSEKAAHFLALLLEKAPDKRLQKLVKKAIFLLRTQGVTIEEPRAGGEPVLKKVETTREAQAFLSSYDPEQTRALISAFELKKNQFLFSQSVIHFTNGLMELRSFPVRRSDLDGLLHECVSGIPRPIVMAAISAHYAGYLLEEAAGISEKEREEARSLNRLLSETKGEVKRPSDIHRLTVPAETAPASIDAILHNEVFEPFLLSWTDMEDDRKRLAELVNPSIVMPPYVIQERKEAFLRELVGSERVRLRLSPLKRMFEDTAYLFYSIGQFDRYRGLIDIVGEPQSIEEALLHFMQKTLDELEKNAQKQRTEVLVDPHSLIRR
jgi:hypothetical protein